MHSSWTVKKIGDLGQIVTGKTPPTKEPENFGGNIPFVTPKDMDGRRIISKTERYLTEKGLEKVKTSYIPAGSVMVSCIGSQMGKVAITGKDCVTNQQINSIIVNDENDALFVYYNLLNRQNELRYLAAGSAQPILNKKNFSQLEILIPPLPEQKAIAHILGTLDDKIELNRRMNETLEEMAKAIFKSWFVDFDPVIDNALKAGNSIPDALAEKAARRRAILKKLEKEDPNLPKLPPEIARLFPDSFEDSPLGPIPRGWRVSSLGDVINLFDHKRIPLSNRERANRQGPYPYYGAAGILDYVNDYLFDGIYMLIGEDGSVIDEEGHPIVQYVWGKFWVNNHAHVIQGKGYITTEFLMLFLKQLDIKAYVTGAVQPKLNQKNLKSIPIVLPSNKICLKFNKLIEPLFDTFRKKEDERKILSSIRDTILPKLISGQIRIKDAEKFVEGMS